MPLQAFAQRGGLGEGEDKGCSALLIGGLVARGLQGGAGLLAGDRRGMAAALLGREGRSGGTGTGLLASSTATIVK